MDEIVASKAAPTELVGSLELMALMADWLDPLVKAAWPEVDGIGDKNPHGGLGELLSDSALLLRSSVPETRTETVVDRSIKIGALRQQPILLPPLFNDFQSPL
jgi:hypothetical protein